MKMKFYSILLILLIIFIIIGSFFTNKRETVAIIGAMDVEINEVLNNLSGKHYKQQGDFKITTGNLGKYKIVLSKSGVGKVNSATTTQFIIDNYKPEYIINIGIAGSLSPDLKTGDTIIVEKMVQHDFDVTVFGVPKGYIDNGVESNEPTIFYSDRILVNKFLNDKNIKRGTAVTGDVFVTDKKLKYSIREEFNADAIDMESAAIAQAAQRNNTPVIVIRTISDELDDTTNEYNKNKQNVVKKPALLIIEALKSDK